jgi:hypothetical protein
MLHFSCIEFLLHSENICYFIQSIHFQEQTERTISSLAFTTAATLESMEGLHELSSAMTRTLYVLANVLTDSHLSRVPPCPEM